jgi:N6-L-threonylcarbamoyladenine synthase
MSNYTLAIETSCDDTSIAILNNKQIITNLVSSQLIHTEYGGIVPEIAAREHVKIINLLIDQALSEAKIDSNQISQVAVTKTPGLIGSLLVGINTAEIFAMANNIPVNYINHITGHVYANFADAEPEYPFIALVVSGGHTQLMRFNAVDEFTILHQTEDDAIGETYDKVGKMLGLPYPAGPHIDKIVQNLDNEIEYKMPKIKLEKNFSFSGIKTHMLNTINQAKMKNQELDIPNLLNSFQKAAIKQLFDKIDEELEKSNYKQLLICGGVSANSELRKEIEKYTNESINVLIPRMSLTVDNAAMIGLANYYQNIKGE